MGGVGLGTLIDVLGDRSTQGALVAVLLLDVYTCYRAHQAALRAKWSGTRTPPSAAERFVSANAQTLERGWAYALPVVATCTLVALFFVLRKLGPLLTALSAAACIAALSFMLLPIVAAAVRCVRPSGARADDKVADAVALLPAVVCVGAWLWSGSWWLNNVLGCALCVLFGAVCRLDSLRAATILYAGLFVYDVFFVFFSDRLFGQNVMVQVATSAPRNPAAVLAAWLHLPKAWRPVETLALPAKLIFPDGAGAYAILGLGDIVLPIMLLVFLLELDVASTDPLHRGFTIRALAAHILALLASFYCNVAFRAAQPALFYIVPAMLGVTFWTAHSKGVLGSLWTEPSPRDAYSELPDAAPLPRADDKS